jgi:hypothetical protein
MYSNFLKTYPIINNSNINTVAKKRRQSSAGRVHARGSKEQQF